MVKRLRPVSYTHLDVYKRQTEQWTDNDGILNTDDAADPGSCIPDLPAPSLQSSPL